MAGPRYRAAAAGVLNVQVIDEVLTAVFHRSSGITHLLAEPAPEILSMLDGVWLAEGELLARLADRYDIEAGDGDALAARLRELAAAELVECSAGAGTP